MLATNRYVRIDAVPSNANLTMEDHHRVLIVVNTAADREDMLLRPTFCHDRNGRRHRCDEFVILFEDQVDVETLEERASELPGRLVRSRLRDSSGRIVFEAGDYATVVIFDGVLNEAMREAAGWPGVRSVEPVMVGQIAGGPPIQNNRMTVALPVEFDAHPVGGDRILQAERGNVIVATYEAEGVPTVRASTVIGAR